MRAAPVPFPYVYEAVPDTAIDQLTRQEMLNKIQGTKAKVLASPELWPPYLNKPSFSHLFSAIETQLTQKSGKTVDKTLASTILTVEKLIVSASNNYQQYLNGLKSQAEWVNTTKWLLINLGLNKIEQGLQDRFLMPEVAAVLDRGSREAYCRVVGYPASRFSLRAPSQAFNSR